MRRTCLRAAMPSSVVRLSMELQTPGLPEGQEEGRLGFFLHSASALPSLSIRPLSRSLSHTLSLSLLSWSLVKAAAVQRVHRHPTFPAQPYSIHHGRILTTVCMFPNALDVEKAQTLWVSHIETICPGGLKPRPQLIILDNIPLNPSWKPRIFR